MIDTGKLGIANPAGLAFSPVTNMFLLPEAHKPGETDFKIAMITFFEDLAGSMTVATAIPDPLNLAFDAQTDRLVLFDHAAKELIEIQAKSIGDLQPSAKAITRFEARQFNLTNPQGMTFDPTGRLFVLDAAVPQIVRITPNPRFKFDGAAAARDGRILQIDLNHLADVQPRGVAFNPNTNHLYVLSPAKQTLYELTETGQVVATRDLSSLALRDPQGMVFAPSGDLTDDPALMSLYIADSGRMNGIQGRGQIIELSLTVPASPGLLEATNVRASLVNAIETSEWSPPSPDPMGMAYISSSGRLLVSDSEVAEMSIFEGVNVFESTLQGSLVGTFTAMSFSKEPSGVAFNPSNRHLFFTDDDKDKVFEIDPGTDGNYFTSDDVLTSFDTRSINSMDPEGIAYDSWQGHLFIADGANAEVYEIKPGLNGIFDGQPPVGDDQLAQFDTTPFDILNPEGIEFNPDNGHLYITGPGQKMVVETTTTGTLISVIDLTSTKAQKISGLAYAPSSVNPAVMNLYVSARGVDNNTDPEENDGRIYEASFPSLSINDISVVEGNAGTVDVVFTVTLQSADRDVVTVDYATADGSATAGRDYVAASGTLTFPRGTTTQTIAVLVNSDALDEPHETFFVNLSNPANTTITDYQGRGTITDDDPSPSISINDVTVTEGHAPQGGGNAVFTVTLSTASGHFVTVDYATSDGTATAGSDYMAASGTVTFSPGATTQTIAVLVNGDALDELNETFFVNLSNPANATIAGDQGQGTIIDDDPSISINDITVTEGNAPQGGVNAVFTVTLFSIGNQVVTVDYATADGTATAGSDYVAAFGTLTFSPGTTTQTIAVVVNSDALDEPNETFFVNLSNPANATIADNQGQGTIIDDDSPPSISINDVTVTEGNAGTIDAVFTVTLSAASGQVVTVDYATSDGTAAAGSDYVAASGTLTFSPGTTTQTIAVAVNGESLDEPNEAFFVNVSNPANATIADNQGQGTIVDDDPSPAISINDVTVTEGNTGTIDAVFTITLSAASGHVVTVDYATADSTAIAGRDYLAASGTLTFSPGTTTQTIAVVVNGEALDEPNETFFVNLSNPANATIADNQGQGTIIDDDSSPSISINDVTVTEGNAGTIDAIFTVTLSVASGHVVTVDYGTADGTATAGSDYMAGAGTVNFAAGTTAQTITVVVNGDELDEPNETFFVNLDNPSNAMIADGEGQGTINDDDWPPPIIASFSPTSGPAGTEVTITGTNFTGAISVNFNETPASTFMVDSPTQIRATVPSVATTGKISVTTSGGTVTSVSDFAVGLPTTIAFNPADETNVPTVFALHANVPNPFNPSTTIKYDLAATSEVTVAIFDILGKPVRTLVSERQPAGRYAIKWDGRDSHGRHVSSGVFICQLRVADHPVKGGTGGFVQSRKMLLLQ
ncbi:IPT/TIG domain-containing protein [candidate division KSB1 bacterium]|nr:IPT/TIG domain-containing protein [candidate division KSB1 bacterium]